MTVHRLPAANHFQRKPGQFHALHASSGILYNQEALAATSSSSAREGPRDLRTNTVLNQSVSP